MTSTVNNGSFVEIEFGPHRGRAAMVDDNGVITVAFFAEYRPFRRIETVPAGSIDGRPYRAVASEAGDRKRGLSGMVVLTVEAV